MKEYIPRWNYIDDLMPKIRALGYDDPTKALVDLYVNKKWSMSQIAKAFDLKTFAIWSKLKKLNIPSRGRGGNHMAVKR